MKTDSSPPLSPHVRLDSVNQCLWRDNKAIPLTPKAFLVLRCLMERPGQLVTKEELLNAAWPEVYVGDSALKVCIRRLRQLLNDQSRQPQFIETIPWRGYRFIGEISTHPAVTPQGVSEQSVGFSTSSLAKEVYYESHDDQLYAKRLKGRTVHLRARKRGPDSDSLVVIESARSVTAEKPSKQQEFNLEDTSLPVNLSSPLVGREAVFTTLHAHLETLLHGQQQCVFVTGEPGIGKTAVLEAFLAQVSPDPRWWIAYGQCIEHYGQGEPYLPLLGALERLCHRPGHEHLVKLLHQHAPMWLVQMPSLLPFAERKELRQELQGITQDRMFREFAEVIDILTAERPLVLVLDDLHWSDSATFDLLSFLIRRRQQTRLLLVCAYRMNYITDSMHPLLRLIRELSAHGQCTTLTLDFLEQAAVHTYLANRFPDCPSLPTLVRSVHHRTNGNPLFMVNVVEYLLSKQLLHRANGHWQLLASSTDIEKSIPPTVQQMIELQIDTLTPEEQHLLEVASVAGKEFSAVAVAAGLTSTIPAIEEQCTRLVRRSHLVKSLGAKSWPDGTIAEQYTFIHWLYQDVLYQRIPAGKRAQLHQRIGLRLEEAHGTYAKEIASTLAVHFQNGQDIQRAIRYHRYAAENALRQCAYHEALDHVTFGLELLQTIPEANIRTPEEIALYTTRGAILVATQGYAAPEVEQTYQQARALCHQVQTPKHLFHVLQGLWSYYSVRADLSVAKDIAEQLLTIAQKTQDPAFQLEAHRTLGITFFLLGHLTDAREHLQQSLALYEPQQHGEHIHLYGQDSGAISLAYLANVLWLLGYPEQALHQCEAALILADSHAHPYTLALTHYRLAVVYQMLRDVRRTKEHAVASATLSRAHGFPYSLAASTLLHGWALAAQGTEPSGIAQMQEGLKAYLASGATIFRAHFLTLMAEAYGKVGNAATGLLLLDDALAAVGSNNQSFFAAEIHRTRGELLLQQGNVYNSKMKGRLFSATAQAEAAFLTAITIARAQEAKLLELRAATSLRQLWQQQGKLDVVDKDFSTLLQWFREGQETIDLQDARSVLAGGNQY